ncbi:hypothetical protein P9VFCI_079 [Rhizobium phage P9VFCI]|uniref:GIY-YIG domain-containing protein n=1 Tax=Rhizobium phage P9VFCI TaxID=2763531 RepID=A0A7G7WXB5_9CAUD|nr:homing endonuclease [Rhizobium phage P9VFCI]QNH71859.1 hypothetical protein P9VFCI_079 [Rhizobium phage P9VFCI]
MQGFVYIVTNLINGKRYIGRRKGNHEVDDGYRGSGLIVKAAHKVYGIENFSRKILEVCSTPEELEEREKHWIKEYDAVKDPSFYNLSPGGKIGGRSHGYVMTQETRMKIRGPRGPQKNPTYKLRKSFQLKDPSGKVHSATGIGDFAFKNGLHQGALSSVLNGTLKSHKGWTLP